MLLKVGLHQKELKVQFFKYKNLPANSRVMLWKI